MQRHVFSLSKLHTLDNLEAEGTKEEKDFWANSQDYSWREKRDVEMAFKVSY